MIQIYAEIKNNLVVNTIVADEQFIAAQTNKTYVVCTRGGIGWTYDGTNFIAPKPYFSWTLDSNFDWQPPVPYPEDDKVYAWFEPNKQWIEVVAS